MRDRPNFLIIMSDQHHAGIMGCAGDGVIRTPHLDRIAARGVRFDRCYTPSPLCVPARMAFMTGQYPSDTGARCNEDILGSDIPTFAHALSLAGYETALCGRMHFTGPDQRHGFEKRLVGDLTGVHHRLLRPEADQLMRDAVEAMNQSWHAANFSGPGRSFILDYDDEVTGAGVDFLDNRTDERPLCLVVGTFLPHCPFVIDEELFESYRDRVPAPHVPEGYFETVHPLINQWIEDRGVTAIDPAITKRVREAYYGMVTYFDRLVGRLLDALERSGAADDTVVIYCSDHGEMAGEHGMFWKSNFFEGSVRVPLLASWPDRFARGAVVDANVNLVDIGPTLIELAGAPPLPLTRGRSLARFLSGEGVDDWANETFSEHYNTLNLPPGRMIRKDAWKLVHYHGHDTPMLFDVERDPEELNDLGADPDHAALRQELLARVLGDWDGGRVEGEVNRKRKEYAPYLAQWGEATQLEHPEYWQGRNEMNRFTPPA